MNLLWVCNIWPKSRLSWSNWSLNWSWHFMTSLSSLSSVKNAVFNSMYYCATTMSQYRSNKIISLPNQVSLYGISDLKVSHFKVRQIQVESAGGSVGLERLFPAGCLLSWAATARGRCLCPRPAVISPADRRLATDRQRCSCIYRGSLAAPANLMCLQLAYCF